MEVELDSVELDKLIEKGKEILNCIDSPREKQAPATKEIVLGIFKYTIVSIFFGNMKQA